MRRLKTTLVIAVAFGACLALLAGPTNAAGAATRCASYPAISNQAIKSQCRVDAVRSHYQELCARPSDPILTAGSPVGPCEGWQKRVRALRVVAHYTTLCIHDQNGIGISGGGSPVSPCLGWRLRVFRVLVDTRRSIAGF